MQFKKKSVFRTSIGVTCAYSDLQSAAHSREKDLRIFLPQVRDMLFAAFGVIILCCDGQYGAKPHAPHLRKKKPHVIHRNMQPRVWSQCIWA